MDNEAKKAKIKAMTRQMTVIMNSDDKAAKARVFETLDGVMQRMGLSDVHRTMVKVQIRCVTASEPDRVRMLNDLAQRLDITFLFESEPPKVECYQKGEELNTLDGKGAVTLFDEGQALAARVGCGHHEAMRSLMMYAFVSSYMDDVKEHMKAAGLVPSWVPGADA